LFVSIVRENAMKLIDSAALCAFVGSFALVACGAPPTTDDELSSIEGAAITESALTSADQKRMKRGGSVEMWRADGSATAAFSTHSSAACRTRNVSLGCIVVECDGDADAHPVDVDAGRIDITGGAAPIVLVPGADHSYAGFSPDPLDAAFFSPSKPIAVRAAGGGIGPFQISHLGLPTPVHVTNLDVIPDTGVDDGTHHVTIPTNENLEIRWSGGRSADWTSAIVDYTSGTWKADPEGGFSLDTSAPGSKHITLECLFPAAAGRGVLPKAALKVFPPGSDTPFSQVSDGAPARGHALTIGAQRRDWTSAGAATVEAKVWARAELTTSITFQ
jgi:hypothetical protein